MQERFEYILGKAIRSHSSDIHLKYEEEKMSILMRTIHGLVKIKEEVDDEKLFNYLQYHAHLDVTSLNKPQSGSFTYFFKGKFYDFRFAVFSDATKKSGVLRILNWHEGLKMSQLTYDPQVRSIFESYLSKRTGLILFSGLTGSGKTTTMYSLLRMCRNRTIYTLEDPIEIQMKDFVQMQINEKVGFGYDEGIKQVLRHNPDILMIGEIRDETTAQMTVRAALTGCLVFSSIHSRSALSTIQRLLELKVSKQDLTECLDGIVNQRLCTRKNRNEYIAVYDILTRKEIEDYLLYNIRPKEKMSEQIHQAILQGIIEDDEYE